MNTHIQTIIQVFEARGSESYADEPVTQLEHALQCAALAQASGANDTLVISALLHDIGHIMSDHHLPEDLEEDLHDFHESRGYEWVKGAFGPNVADPVRLHVAAKRYLCTVDPAYESLLSPTSQKSFLDQGGKMSFEELKAFETEPGFEAALELRRWDDQAKKSDWETPGIEYYVPVMERLLNS